MKKQKVVFIIYLLFLFLFLFSFSFKDYQYSFGIIVLGYDSSITIPPYLKNDFLLSKLKWLSKIELNDTQIEKIRQINKNSIISLYDFINTDFLFIIELFTDSTDLRIHIYSFFHDLYCTNIMAKLDNQSITLNFLNLLHNLILKIANNYEKRRFKDINEIIFRTYIDENKNSLYIIPSNILYEFLLISLYTKYSTNQFILNYYQNIINYNIENKYKYTTDFSSIIYNLSEKISKTILNHNYFESIGISEIDCKIITEKNIKNSIADLLKTKLSSNEYKILSLLLFN